MVAGFSVHMRDRRAVSIRTVAEQAGVSTATVSNVLSGKASVTQALADRVRAAVEHLGYVADGSASRLRSGKQALAGVVVPDLGNPFFGAFVSTLERLAREDEFDLLVVSSSNEPAQEAARLDKIRSWRPAGLIVIPCDGALSRRLPRAMHAPIVAVDRIPDDDAFDLVAVDNRSGAAAVAAHCAGRGFASCLVVGGTLDISNIRERWEGVMSARESMSAALVELGLRPDVVRQRLREHLSRAPRPELVFALDHATTLATYEVLLDLGLDVGRDIALASFDDAEWMRLVRPGLTTVRQPVEALAQAAWDRLMARIGGDVSPPCSLRLSCTIEIRDSTVRPAMPSRHAAA